MKHRQAIVTGASSPIGIETVRRLVKADFDVIGVTRNQKHLAEKLRLAGVSSEHVVVVESDLANVEQAPKTIEEAISHGGSPEVLVNAVGQFSSAPVIQVTPVDIIGSYIDNVVAPYVAMRAVLPAMIAKQQGSIVNVASLFGLVVPREARCLAYGAAKAALVHLTKLMAFELGRYFIRVNCICPGPLNDVTDSFSVERYERLEGARMFFKNQGIPRLATPEEVAEMVEYLVGDSARNVTGAIFRIDSGYV